MVMRIHLRQDYIWTRSASLVLILAAFLAGPYQLAKAQGYINGCQMFPSNCIFNTDISGYPVDSNSDMYINTVGSGTGLHPDFGAPIVFGIPYNVVPDSRPKSDVSFEVWDESDPGPYAIGSAIEGGDWGDGNDGDRHVLTVDYDANLLYETFSTYDNGDGTYSAYAGAIFDLTSNQMRPDGWTSADAAGFPITPLLVRYDEATAGSIRHAFRCTFHHVYNYQWPASHLAGSYFGYPPLGNFFRLRA